MRPPDGRPYYGGVKDHVRFDAARKRSFLDILALSGRPATAARKVGVSERVVQRHRKEGDDLYDSQFAEDYESSMQLYRELLAAEVHRRAVEGVEEPVFYQGRVAVDKEGRPVGIVKFSDAMLALLIKRHDPSFRERQVIEQHNVNVNAALNDLEKLSPESRRKLREILEAEDGQSAAEVS